MFALIVRNLGRTVGDIMFRDRSTATFLSLLQTRLSGLIARFTAIAIRVEAGTLRAAPRRGVGRRVTKAARRAGPLPTGYHWLGKLVPEANGFGSQLAHLVLNDAEMMALLVAAPQAGRILRSIFWMVGQPVPAPLRRVAVAPSPRPVVRAVKPARTKSPPPRNEGRWPRPRNPSEKEGGSRRILRRGTGPPWKD